MTSNALKYIADSMEQLKMNYEFEFYSKDRIYYPYFIGDYTEVPVQNEDGLEETDFRITGCTRGTWAELEEAKAKIKRFFPPVGGKIVIFEDGSSAAFMYQTALHLQSEDPALKRIQIDITVKEWSVNDD